MVGRSRETWSKSDRGVDSKPFRTGCKSLAPFSEENSLSRNSALYRGQLDWVLPVRLFQIRVLIVGKGAVGQELPKLA